MTDPPDGASALRLVALASLLVQLSDDEAGAVTWIMETVRLGVPLFDEPALPLPPLA